MLITNYQNELLKRFGQLVSRSTKLWIVNAWATEGPQLEIVRNCSCEVRAIIGTYGLITEPEALKVLLDLSNSHVKLVRSQNLFHPKVFIFEGEKNIVWVGSANFTRAGFATNVEAVLESDATSDIYEWIDSLWNECIPLDEDELYKYRCSYEHYRDRDISLRSIAFPEPHSDYRQVLLREAIDWADYYNGLLECEIFYREHFGGSIHVFDVGIQGHDSCQNTIRRGNGVILKDSWIRLDYDDYCLLLGKNTDSDTFGFLGNLQGAGQANGYFNPANDTRYKTELLFLHESVHSIIDADLDEDDFLILVSENLDRMCSIPGIRLAVATRLLTLARPDRLVSLNGGSEPQLREAFGIRTRINSTRQYVDFLDRVYSKEWYQTPEPFEKSQREVWRYRAALLDVFVYVHPI